MISNSFLIRLAAATALATGIAFAPTVRAAQMDDNDDSAQAVSEQTTDAQAAMGQNKPAPHMHGRAEVEAHIQTLHDKLKITNDQEDDWQKVAQAMRDNEGRIHELIAVRRANAGVMTAVDDLKSYQDIAQAHADGLNSVIGNFEVLYGEMSDAQKQNADQVFGHMQMQHDKKMPQKHSK